MSYYNKYLKYKEKYLQLKNQLGGNKDTFYIYTTGIADWGDADSTLAAWQKFLCKQICDMIPKRFKYIHITHSDILVHHTLEDTIDEKKKIIYMRNF